MTQQMLGDANANTFQIKSGMGDVLVQGGGGDDLLVVDCSHKASAVTSYSAWGPHSHGPAWLQSGTDHVGYGEVATATDFAQFSRLLMKAGAGSDTIWGGAVSNEIHGGAGNDQIYGLVGADQLYGDAGNDTLYGDGQYGVGGGGADQLFGGAGNDTLVGGAGNDKLDGGVGTDTAVFSGNRANYQVGSDGHGHVTVTDLTGADGTDTLTSIEKVQFADGTWSVNSQGVLAAAASASASASAGGHGAAPASHDWHLMG